MRAAKLTMIASLALTITLGFWSVGAVEKGSARGGAGDLVKPVIAVSEESGAVVMECPKCKSDWLVRTDLSARGAIKPTYLAEKHLCSKCRTELKMVGSGKYAKNIPVHLCTACKK